MLNSNPKVMVCHVSLGKCLGQESGALSDRLRALVKGPQGNFLAPSPAT